uniref:Immunoglobulin V-set domain-containing protein n=1 Tax=Poecilia formosa TaxID=48698 RepID=A0A087YQW5_POEFO
RICVVISSFCLFLTPAGKSLPTLNETLDVYEAEEHSNATLTWIRPDPNATPPDWLYIDLSSMEPLRRIYLFDSRVQPETYTDDEFKGRLHCDPQLVGNGRIRCLLTDVRLSDAGRYQWYVVTDGGRNLRHWELVVRGEF